MNGWLNLYKPKDISSAKFLAVVKRALYTLNKEAIKQTGKGFKIGHTGTLDPLAQGILPVALGEATKLADILVNARKTYYFVVQFGARTASGDLGSEIIEQTDNKVTEEELVNILPNFIGNVTQKPSKFSAIKIKGQRAYKLARNGEEFEMPERQIEIYDLKINFFNPETQQAGLICECSKGTYIRTLAEDVAFSLNNLGFVIELHRFGVGKFNLENSVKLDIDNQDSILSIIQDKLLPINFVLDDILVINVSSEIASKIRFGQKISFEGYSDGFYAILSEDSLCSIGNIVDGIFSIRRVFNL